MRTRFLKKTAALLLSLILTAGTVGCLGQSADTTEHTSAPVTETEPADPLGDIMKSLPDADYEGYVFRLIGANYISAEASAQQIPVDELKGDLVNDSLWERDNIVAEKYNLNFEYRLIDDATEIVDTVRKSVQAGDDDIDMFYSNIVAVLPLVSGGFVMDFNTLPNVDLDKPWWSQYARQDMTIDGKYFFALGDITPRLYSSPYIMMFNKKMVEDYHLTSPYSMVSDGTWTFGNMTAMLKDVTSDLDGNGVLDYHDRFGMAYENWSSFSYYIGCGQHITENKGGSIRLIPDSELSVGVIQMIQDVLTNTDYSLNIQKLELSDFNAVFGENRALFFNTVISTVPNFRNMNTDFGLLPPPKYNEAQEQYYVYAQPHAAAAAYIPVSASDADRTGMIVEALGAAALHTTTPAYYELTLKTKISRDNESAEMLNIIFNNVICDLDFTFNWGDSRTVLRDSMITDKDFMSSYEAIREKAEKEIENDMEMIRNLP